MFAVPRPSSTAWRVLAARLRPIDPWLQTWGPALLLVFAVLYYGQYYRSGLNLGGEGGTVAVNAIRLNEGWLPIKDTTLNYNVLWFYPVAWLFQLTGPDYITLRIYFFGLCAVAGLLGFLIVRRVSRCGWLAVGAGLLILLIPGMQFRNYMGLLPLLNAWALLHAFVFAPAAGGRKWLRFAVAGAALGVTFLVRVDLGLFFSVIYLGLVALYPLGERGAFWRRSRTVAAGGVLGLAMTAAVHAPFVIDAQRRGFGPEFTNQYTAIWSYLKYEAGKVLSVRLAREERVMHRPPEAEGSELIPVRFKKTPKDWAQLARAEQEKRLAAQKQGRPRQGLRDLFTQDSFYAAAFILIVHLPILIGAMIFLGSSGAFLGALLTANAARKEAALVSLVTLGAALTLFPQYFFFRPDTPHLSEFMVPFLVAMMCASFYAVCGMAGARSRLFQVAAGAFVVLCVGAEGLYFYHSFPKESSGSIAAARRRSHELVADNGVRVLVKRREQPWLQAMHDSIVRFSGPDDWVVTFPYSPTINFLTNRRSYLKDLYIDNATVGRNFFREKVAEIERYRPAVIVIDQRDINNTEISRFKHWAAPTYEYIRQRYVRIPGEFDSNEIYVRPDKLPPQA